jgi:hypothetical protein
VTADLTIVPVHNALGIFAGAEVRDADGEFVCHYPSVAAARRATDAGLCD